MSTGFFLKSKRGKRVLEAGQKLRHGGGGSPGEFQGKAWYYRRLADMTVRKRGRKLNLYTGGAAFFAPISKKIKWHRPVS